MSPPLPSLPDPLRSTLARVAGVRPVEAAAATAALTQTLAPVADSPWPEVAWSFSTLTGTGFPVELAWASRDTALRWTAEVGGAELAETRRLTKAAEVAAATAGAAPDVEVWARLQHGRPLRWGAWLGLRHRAAATAAKVYLELPADVALPAPWAEPAAAAAAALPGLRWRMAGANDDGTIELYARVPAPTVTGLTGVGALAGDGPRLADLVAALTRPAPEPPRPSGVSLVLTAAGEPLATTWFGFAKSLWSTDARAGVALGRLVDEGAVSAAAGSLELYRALAGGPDDGRRRHGMVGVGVDAAGGAWLQAGLRPT